MPRTFNTPRNQAKKRKIISASIIITISIALIAFQLLKSSNSNSADNSGVVRATQEESPSSTEINGYYEATINSLLLEVEELKIKTQDQQIKIKKLEKEIKKLNGEDVEEDEIYQDDDEEESLAEEESEETQSDEEEQIEE